MNDKTLTAVFSAVGKRYGYDEIQAEFVPFRDFKVRWMRSYKWISLEISDYMKDAPEEIMESMAVTIFRKIKGEDELEYSEEVYNWLTREDFVHDNQSTFIHRFRGLSLEPQGKHQDLAESYKRLVKMGLVEDDPDVFMGWAPSSKSQRVGRSSVLMKVIVISQRLDDPGIPEHVLDYCLYAQAAHIGMGFSPSKKSRGKEYDEILGRYPDRAEAESELRRRDLFI